MVLTQYKWNRTQYLSNWTLIEHQVLTEWNSTEYWLHWTANGSCVAATIAQRLKRETRTWNSNVKDITRVLWFVVIGIECVRLRHEHTQTHARRESERPNWMLKHVWIHLNDVNQRLVIMIAQRANMHEVNVNDFQAETHKKGCLAEFASLRRVTWQSRMKTSEKKNEDGKRFGITEKTWIKINTSSKKTVKQWILEDSYHLDLEW